MKQNHTIICAILVVVVIFGWFAAITGIGDPARSAYNAHITQAEDYFQRGLFQKAISEFEAALEIKDTVEVWASMLQAYEARYAENADIYDDYVDAVSNAVGAYDDNIDFVKKQVQLYLTEDEVVSAFNALEHAIDAGIDDKAIVTLHDEIKFRYDMRRGDYSAVESCVNGYYRIKRNGYWDYMDLNGSFSGLVNVTFLGAVGEDDIRVLNENDRIVLMDDDDVVQGILPAEVEAVGIYSDERIPAKVRGVYGYYDILGDKLYGEYQMASSYESQIAAVQQNETWYLIDENGERISENNYEDVRLNIDGTALKEDVFAAKVDGKYHLFNEKEEKIGDFSCTDIGVVTEDGAIAFCRDGKWGYVNTDGEELIAPAYAGAKSFSNGLAAVFDGNLWGFVDAAGYLAIPYQFKDVDYFSEEGTCLVMTEEEWQLLRLYVSER